MSFKIEHPQRWIALCLSGCSLLLWGFYMATLSPAFPPDDSPETITAAFSLGIQHPPGYPLAALLGRCAIVAVPLGPPTFRVNALSAALACLAAALAGALAWRLTEARTAGRLSAALLGCLGLGVLGAFWDQATEAKGGIYLLNLALGFGLWHSALSVEAWGWRRTAILWGGLGGLMLADHYPSAVLWLAPTGLWLAWQARQAQALQSLKLALVALLPGLSLYAYLPLRAMHAPLLNWGAPSTWSQFWWVLSRGGYTQAQVTDHALVAHEQVQLWWASLWQPGLLWSLPLALVGLLVLWRSRRPALAALTAAITLGLFAALVFNKTPVENRWLALIFALPATALLAPLAGVGLATLLEGAQPTYGRLGVALGLGLCLWAAKGHRLKADRSGSYVAWDYANDLSLSLPKGALYMAEGDYHVLPLLHAQAVEGKRGDVLSVLNVLTGNAWYQDLLLCRDPKLRLPANGSADRAVVEMALLNARARPLRIGPFSELLDEQRLGQPLRQAGLNRGLGAPQAEPDQSLAWAARRPARSEADLEKVESDLLPWYTVALVQIGNDRLASGRPLAAISAYRRALDRPGPKPVAPLAGNLGLAYEAAGRKELAIRAFSRALSVDPSFTPAAQHLQALQGHP